MNERDVDVQCRAGIMSMYAAHKLFSLCGVPTRDMADAVAAKFPPCGICRRIEGTTGINRYGEKDGISDHIALGPVRSCPRCGAARCPECMERCGCGARA